MLIEYEYEDKVMVIEGETLSQLVEQIPDYDQRTFAMQHIPTNYKATDLALWMHEKFKWKITQVNEGAVECGCTACACEQIVDNE